MAAAGTTMARSTTPRARDFVATPMGTGFAGGLLRCAAAATRYCVAADCGSSRWQPFPRRTAPPPRVRAAHEGDQPFAASCALQPIPQNRVRDHVGLNQRFPSAGCRTCQRLVADDTAKLRCNTAYNERAKSPLANPLKGFVIFFPSAITLNSSPISAGLVSFCSCAESGR